MPTPCRSTNPNSLHVGIEGFDKRVWTAAAATGQDTASLELAYTQGSGKVSLWAMRVV